MSILKASRRRRTDGERGGALLELAVSIPIFLLLIAIIFDAGLGFSAARASSSAARSAARTAALAGDERLADFAALDAVRAEYENSRDTIVQVTVYRSVPGTDGSVPSGCGLGGVSQTGLCNVYAGAMVESVTVTGFDGTTSCSGGSPDRFWCPVGRRADDGDYLGVAVWTQHEQTVGLFDGNNDGEFHYDLADRAVFALYFPPLPTT